MESLTIEINQLFIATTQGSKVLLGVSTVHFDEAKKTIKSVLEKKTVLIGHLTSEGWTETFSCSDAVTDQALLDLSTAIGVLA